MRKTYIASRHARRNKLSPGRIVSGSHQRHVGYTYELGPQLGRSCRSTNNTPAIDSTHGQSQCDCRI